MATIIETTDAPDSGVSSPYSITPVDTLTPGAPEGDEFLGSLGFGFSSDSDVIETDLLEGTEYSLALTPQSPFTLGTFVVEIYDSSNNLIATGDETFTITTSGTYYISISTSSGSDASAGDYSLVVNTISIPVVPVGPTDGDDVLIGTEERDVIDLLEGNDSFDAVVPVTTTSMAAAVTTNFMATPATICCLARTAMTICRAVMAMTFCAAVKAMTT